MITINNNDGDGTKKFTGESPTGTYNLLIDYLCIHCNVNAPKICQTYGKNNKDRKNIYDFWIKPTPLALNLSYTS